MLKLANRQKQIPHGFKFRQPETGWTPRSRFESFDSIVNGLMAHRRAHPALAEKNKWNLDYAAIADEVDQFNSRICLSRGWLDYIIGVEGATPIPKTQALLDDERRQISVAAGLAKKIWSGVRTLDEWLDAGGEPVEAWLADQRAACCAACPKNGQGDFTRWFTNPASAAITKQIERASGRGLKTKHDPIVNICEVCLCPMKLKVHTPIKFIARFLSPEVLSELRKVKNCWIVSEMGG